MKGKRRTPKEVEADRQAYAKACRHQGVTRFEYQRKRAESAGITHYRWSTSRGAASCATCRERNGKVFSYREPPGFTHPGTVECDDGENCRCVMVSIVEGFTS